jgi:hypothetical protein
MVCAIEDLNMSLVVKAKEDAGIEIRDEDDDQIKIEKARRSIRQAEATAQVEVGNIQAWLQDFKTEQQQTIDYFESLLRPYARRELTGSKKRSLKLPKGVLGFRKANETYIKNNDTLLKWADASAPEWVKTKREVDWATIKGACTISGDKLVTPDGEIVSGVTVEIPADDIFYTKTEEKEAE